RLPDQGDFGDGRRVRRGILTTESHGGPRRASFQRAFSVCSVVSVVKAARLVGDRARISGVAFLVFVCSLLPAQESAPESAPNVDRIVEKANHQSPYVSAQGLKALKAQGAAALPALERFIARRSILALAPLVVDWLGEVPEDGARAVLRQGLAHRGFP